MENLFRKYEVKDVRTIEEFLTRYYKQDRYTGRGEAYAKELLNDYKESFAKEGFIIISRHDSSTGSTVSFFYKN